MLLNQSMIVTGPRDGLCRWGPITWCVEKPLDYEGFLNTSFTAGARTLTLKFCER